MAQPTGNQMPKDTRPTGVVAVMAQETPNVTNFARTFSVAVLTVGVESVVEIKVDLAAANVPVVDSLETPSVINCAKT